eukprot:CAMPEP_0115548614 /NCGR_PEP_ID=MMETSP0271-20121206/94255_1 /TAXON_ID=71861 /ORGANISM="Scrippsiella trochoidea, Strain CCMP3099" /LENGTH=69 /DNA_ID=CAMNT_0002982087 /DNA_START=36 /DNA_END=241 /DNA_ORIENTATION=-
MTGKCTTIDPARTTATTNRTRETSPPARCMALKALEVSRMYLPETPLKSTHEQSPPYFDSPQHTAVPKS